MEWFMLVTLILFAVLFGGQVAEIIGEWIVSRHESD